MRKDLQIKVKSIKGNCAIYIENTVFFIRQGYIGLPIASIFAANGFEVVGVDTDDSVVSLLNNGKIRADMYEEMAHAENPFGDGQAARRMI